MDIPVIDTTTPNGQQTYMTRNQAYMLNSQVNSFLCSCPLYLDNGNVCAFVFLGMMERMKGRGSAWTGFDHDIIFGANGAARSISDLPHSNNGGGADGAAHSVSDLPCSSNGGWGRKSSSFCFGPFAHQKIDEERTELFVPFQTSHIAEISIEGNS